MSESVQAVRGMNDLLPPDSAKWGFFERSCRRLFERHGYEEIRTPVLEHTALFARGIGEATDIVEKEMYTFLDRKQRSLTMRPEMTASCVRAYIEHTVAKREPVTRWYYSGPMFRYERMQTGRYRQFYQIGVECFGVAEPTVEAEQIAMLVQLYDGLGVPALSTLVNSVGGAEDRPRYRAALLAYLQPRASELCPDCQRRLATNPLRVLDCKVDAGSEVLAGAPRVLDSLTDASRVRFDAACQALTDLGVGFRIEPRLVRGLDYYTGLVFEIQSASPALGSQSALVGGGRYDELVESMGGPPTPAVGFALGVERGILALPGPAESFQPRPHLFLVCHGEAARRRALVLAHSLRVSGLRIELEHRAVGVKAQFKRADKLRARAALVLGDDELASGRGKLRDMTSGQEREVALADLAAELTAGDPGGQPGE
jgi:histidyl-tRNA synthetase